MQNHFHTDDFDQWTSATACVVGEGLLSRYKIKSKFNVRLQGNLKAIYIINVGLLVVVLILYCYTITEETQQLLLQAQFLIAGSKTAKQQ